MTLLVALIVAAGLQAPTTDVDLQGALARFQAGDCPGVISTLSDAAPFNIEPPFALLATCYLQLGRSAEAAATLREGLTAFPESGVLKRMLGRQLFLDDAQSAEAGRLLEEAMAALPGDPESRHYFAQWAYVNNRDVECAEREGEVLEAVGLNETARLQASTLMAMCHARGNNDEAARAAFEVAWQVNMARASFDPAAAFQYVRFLSENAETGELQAVLSELLARAPRYGPALIEQARLLAGEGKPAQAIEAARRGLEGDGNDQAFIREAHVILARCYFMLGDTARAAEEQAWVDEHPVMPARGASQR